MHSDWETSVETAQHRRVRDSIRHAIGSWRRFIVAIDGVDGAGKSNLARYLAWQLGIPVVESDLFLDSISGGLNYRWDRLQAVIDARTTRDRPAIIEGVRALLILQQLHLSHDYLVWVAQEGHGGSHALSSQLGEYQLSFAPEVKADFHFWRGHCHSPGCNA